jgi:hypothetical protein
MERQWKGNNVNLSVLADSVARFFRESLCDVSIIESENYRMVVRPKQSSEIVGKIEIFVEGQPNDFSVRFDAGSLSRALVRYGSLVSLLGGGFFVLKGLRSQESLEKLEKRFWLYLSEEIWKLTNSAS